MITEAALLDVLKIGHVTSIRSVEGLSLREALIRARYAELRPEFEVSSVEALVRKYRSLIDEWALYSDDKRTSGGWYLDVKNRAIGQVQHPESVERFESVEAAVAQYVVRELDFWHSLGMPPNKSLECTREK